MLLIRTLQQDLDNEKKKASELKKIKQTMSIERINAQSMSDKSSSSSAMG